VSQADYVFGMTHSHIDTVMMLFPTAAEKTFLLREFDETLDHFEKDISDPIGGSYDVYLNCRDQIEQGIASLLRFIDRGQPPGPAQARQAAVALGADHGGYTRISRTSSLSMWRSAGRSSVCWCARRGSA
jgi:hypothetical protein